MKKVLFILTFLFTLANLADLVTFFLLGNAGVAGDSNPLIVFFGTPIWMYALKIAITFAPWYIFANYDKIKGDFAKYMTIDVFALGILALSLGAYSNILGLQNPHLMEAASAVTNEVKLNYYKNFIGFTVVLPLAVSLIVFKIWQLARNKNGR